MPELTKRAIKNQINALTEQVKAGTLSPEERHRRLERLMLDHELARSLKQRQSRSAAAWAPLINGLMYDKRNASFSGKRFKTLGHQAEAHAYAEYVALLELLVKRFRVFKKSRVTPQEAMKMLEEKGVQIHGRGKHWTDWVSPKQYANVMAVFDAVPHRPKVKRFTPFQRRQHMTLADAINPGNDSPNQGESNAPET